MAPFCYLSTTPIIFLATFFYNGFFAWILWSVVHIFFLIGFRNKFRVFVEWMWQYFSFKRGVHLIADRFTESE